jgi:hypothetical protein
MKRNGRKEKTWSSIEVDQTMVCLNKESSTKALSTALVSICSCKSYKSLAQNGMGTG